MTGKQKKEKKNCFLRKLRLAAGGLVILAFLWTEGCGSMDKEMKDSETKMEAGQPAETRITQEEIRALSEASLKLFQETLKQMGKEDENILISQSSILTALGMTENGAGSETLAAMEQVLSGGMKAERLNEILYTLQKRMRESKEVEFRIADSVWVRSGRVELQEAFIEDVKKYYNADVFHSPFDQTTVDDMNRWVKKNTNQMIPSIIEEIPTTAAIYLMNAIAFEGDWEEPYEKEEIDTDGRFCNGAGETETGTMLHSEETAYFQLNGGTGFLKYYKGREYAFAGILPPEGMSALEYVADLKPEDHDFAEAVRNAREEEVFVTIPEFSFEDAAELQEVLEALGMGVALQEGADFSAMVTEDSDPVWIERVIHKTYIEVNRRGTKAAAVTSVEMEAGGAMEEPLVLTFDRPYVFAIVESETGLPIFMGCVNRIAE